MDTLNVVGDIGWSLAATTGSGRGNCHWCESVFGNELMSPFIAGAVNPISRVTVASLADVGYTVNLNAADAFGPL